MKELIYEVEVRYNKFTFTDADEALAFAMCAKMHDTEDITVEIHVLEKKDETQE